MLPLARNVATSVNPIAPKHSLNSPVVTRCPPTLIPRRNAANRPMTDPLLLSRLRPLRQLSRLLAPLGLLISMTGGGVAAAQNDRPSRHDRRTGNGRKLDPAGRSLPA